MFYWKIDRQIFTRLGFAGWLCIAACNSPREEAAFYPIDSLVTAQIEQLTAVKARLQKEAVLGEKTNSITYTPADTAAWIKELDVFRQLKIINKPINRGSYLIKDGQLDPASNLTVKSFMSTDAELPVRYMKIYYQNSFDKPRKIEASYDEKNSLYESARLLSLEFGQINNKTILTSYSINGGQKMIMGDSVSFIIKGKIFTD